MKLKILFLALFVSALSWGQVALTTDTFGTTAQNPIARTGWTANAASGSNWELRTTAASSVYSWVTPAVSASGGSNVFTNLGTNNNVKTLTYDNSISTVGYTSILVRFGGIKSGTVPVLDVSYSTDGTTYTSASTVTLGTTWAAYAVSLPVGSEGVANLRIRFSITANSNSANNFRIDDFHIVGTSASPPVVTAASPTGVVGTAFSYSVIATNSPTSYAVSPGTLPPGLTLNTTTGVISGTPTTIGTYVVPTTASNSSGASTSVNLTFTISNPPVPVVTASSQAGVVGTAFSYTVVATNSPTSYAMVSGTLPPGLTFSAGAITGTPTSTGSYSIDVTATNAGGTSTAATISFSITATPVPVVTGSSQSGVVGTAFTYTISATNSPTSYLVASGTLPAGLSLNTSTGVISGTPTTVITNSVTVTATNTGGTSAPATINFTITMPIPVVTGSSQSGTVSSAFSYTISATNSPTSYAVASGTLPTGLSLNTTTGVISGTPTTSGSSSVTVTASNSGGTSTAATISFTIAASACVTQGFAAGTTAPSGWVFTGITSTYSSAGNYGVALPSVGMDTTNDIITTEVLPTGNAAAQFSFWFKGQSINSGSTSTLQVDGFDGTTWTNIDIISSATLIASTGTAVTKTYNSGSTPALASGFIRFRLTYKKGVGNLAIDDIAISCTSSAVNPPVVLASSETGTVGSAYSYAINATNFPTSYTIVSGSLPAGLSFNTTSGLISGAPTTIGSYSIDVTATNSGGTSTSATISFTITAYVAGCYTVNFDDGSTKSSYPADNVTLNGKIWNLSETLVGILASDFGTSTYALRMKSSFDTAATMTQDKVNGIGTISFDYKKYTTDTYVNQVFNVEYSKDSGNSWIYIGNVTPTLSTVSTFTATVNQSGPIRVRIIFASGTDSGILFRMNVDNLSICDYVNTTEIEVFGNSTTIANNSVTVSENNNTNFSTFYFVGDAPIVKNFVITNNGTGTLNLSSLSLSSTTFFTISSGLSSTVLTAGQSATFSISFTSTLTGLKSATVTINNDDSDEGTYQFLISTKVYNYIRCTLLPPTIIAQNDFDSNQGYTYTSVGNAAIAAGTNYGIDRTTPSSMFAGSNSLQSKAQLNTITFASLNTQTYQNLELSFKLGGYSVTTGEGLDTPDYVVIKMSTDAGVTYYQQLKITGNSNSVFDMNNSVTTNSSKYKTASTTPVRVGALTSSTNTTPGSYKITGLPSVPDLKIAITFLSTNTNEIWAIDNIAVKGQLPMTTTWDGATWSAGAPTSSTKSIINGYYDTTTNGGSIQTCECQVVSGNTLNISAGDYLEVQSNLTNDGTLNIPNNASLVQVNDEAVNTNTGSTAIVRTAASFKKYDYTYWSSPVETATISSVFSAWRTDYSFEFLTANFSDTLTINNLGVVTAATPDSFDDYAPWAWHNFTGAMTAGQGYAIMGPTNITFPATNVTANFSGKQNNGIITVPIYLSGNGANAVDDFNLIGNPYPSSIFADTFINLNPDISGTLYFWTHVTAISTSNPGPHSNNFISDDYAVYNLTGGTRASLTGSSVPTGYVASGQGFFVEAVNASTAFFNNSMRGKGYANNNFYKHSATESTQVDAAKSRLWLNFQNPEGMFSQQLIAYDANTTLGYDKGYDGVVNVSKNYVSFYSLLNNEAYRIQARSGFDENDVVPLGFFTATTGTYTISIDSQDGVFDGQEVYLQDNLLNIVHDLKQGSYSFDSNYGTFNDRFVLRYTNTSLTSDNFEGIANNVVVATPKSNQISIKSAIEKMTAVSVYDLLGREISNKNNVSENDIVMDNIMAKNQVLIVKIKLENGQTVTRKIRL